MADLFSSFRAGLGDPLEHGAAITPDDSNDLSASTRAIWVGGTGNIQLTTVGGDTVTLNSVPAGLLWVRAKRILDTDTTATDLVALW